MSHFTLRAWSAPGLDAPVADDPRTFDDEGEAVAAYETRLAGGGLVILYRNGTRNAVRHSGRKIIENGA